MEVTGLSSSSAAATRAPVSIASARAIGRAMNLASRSPILCRAVNNVKKDNALDVKDVTTRHGRNLLLASFVAGSSGVGSALALKYEDVVGGAGDAVDRAVNAAADFPIPDFDLDVSGFSNFLGENPIAVVGGLVVLALPLIATNVLGSSSGGTTSAKNAYARLAEDGSTAQLLDIRAAADIRTEGTPDLRTFKKRVVQISYYPENAEAFVTRVKSKFKDSESIVLYILDSFDGSSPSVAKLLAQNGFKEARAIKGGAEGPSGWKNSELPWLSPRKGFTLDLSSLKDVFDTDNPNLIPATLGVAAAAGVGLVVFSEAETALQLLGSAALLQIFVRKFLFAKDRKKTLEDLQTFLDTKIAPKEVVTELKGIGKGFLPEYKDVKSPASNGAALVDKEGQSEESVNEPALVGASSVPELKEGQAETHQTEPASETSTVLAGVMAESPDVKTEWAEKLPESVPINGSTDLPRTNRPLSPYTQFPGMKPPVPPSKPS